MQEEPRQDSGVECGAIGYLVFGRLSEPKKCIVRTRSNSGAVIEVDPDFPIMQSIRLIVPELELQTRCRVLWLQDRMHGLEFISED